MSSQLKYSSPAGPLLTRIQREDLKRSLRSAHTGIFLTSVERQSVREICHAAGDLKRRPEQSLIAFKAFLNDAADDAQIPLGRERAILLERFVSLFIEEMYRAEPKSAREDGDCRGTTVSGIIPRASHGLPDAHL
jgi:hypothetical protein